MTVGGRELDLSEYVVGVKRVFLRTRDRNRNPTLERILFDGLDWPAEEVKEVGSCDTDEDDYDDCPKAERHSLAAWVTPESWESGTDEFGTRFSEQVIVQYYATEGIFEEELRIAAEPESGWVARKAAAGREVTLWFVVRDDRGGVSWAERRVRVR